MKDLISIIVPIYNAEKELNKCLESILSQTYQNFELILIDDGSSDNSKIICDYYEKKDSRIKVFHKQNEGVSIARNIGLEMSSGKYIGFIDSDDWVDSSMYEILYNTIITENADISLCSYVKEYKDDKQKVVKYNKKEVSNTYESIEKFLNGKFGGCVWNKLFKKSIIVKNFDKSLAIGEDSLFLYYTLKNAQKVVCLPQELYHYYVRNDSATNTKFNLKRFDTLKSSEIIFNDVKHFFLPLKECANYMLFNKYFGIMNLIMFNNLENEFSSQFSFIKSRLNQIKNELKRSKYKNYKKLIIFRFFLINSFIYKISLKLIYKKNS
jgi:glycosyltransferase involved in cell wall biosynthesis